MKRLSTSAVLAGLIASASPVAALAQVLSPRPQASAWSAPAAK